MAYTAYTAHTTYTAYMLVHGLKSPWGRSGGEKWRFLKQVIKKNIIFETPFFWSFKGGARTAYTAYTAYTASTAYTMHTAYAQCIRLGVMSRSPWRRKVKILKACIKKNMCPRSCSILTNNALYGQVAAAWCFQRVHHRCCVHTSYTAYTAYTAHTTHTAYTPYTQLKMTPGSPWRRKVKILKPIYKEKHNFWGTFFFGSFRGGSHAQHIQRI